MSNDKTEKEINFIKKEVEKKNSSKLGLSRLTYHPRYEIRINL